jgi:hypothetical protein
MSAHVRWAAGGHARVESIATGAIVLRSTVPSPPGSRIEGTIEEPGPLAPIPLRVKVHACRKRGEGEFVLRGRPVDLTREQRDRLHALVEVREG